MLNRKNQYQSGVRQKFSHVIGVTKMLKMNWIVYNENKLCNRDNSKVAKRPRRKWIDEIKNVDEVKCMVK